MAGIEYSSLDEFLKDLGEIAEIPDGVAEEMLQAEAEIAVEAQKQSAVEHGLVDSGQLVESIRADKKMRTKGTARYVDVYPKGNRKKRTRYRTTRADKAARKSRPVRNAEVAFIHEYGAPKKHITAKKWIKKANDRAADRAVGAAAEVHDKYLKSKNL